MISKKQVEFSMLKIDFLIKNTHLPIFQRLEDDEHTHKIFEGIKKQYEENKEIFLPGTISVAKISANPKFILFDGQHRLRALQKLSEIYNISQEKLRVDIYNVNTEQEVSNLYNIINTNKKVELFTGNLEPYIIPMVQRYIKQLYPSFCKNSKNPKNLNINLDILAKRLQGYKIVEKLNIQSGEELIEKIRNLNNFYSNQSHKKFIDWGIKDFPKKYDELLKDVDNPLFLGLFRHYEWIERLLENKEYSEQDHSIREKIVKESRKKIPKVTRRNVWDKKFEGNLLGLCYCCDQEVDFELFDCGHIISVKEGGNNNLDNLEVVCRKCNLDMGSMNMNKYKELF